MEMKKIDKDTIREKEVRFAFNIWSLESALAVIDAASELNQSVILQTSVGVYKRVPHRIFAKMIKQYAEYKSVDVWLNLDHCKDENILMSAIDNGWDMVMADGSSLSIDENITFTNRIVEYAHRKGVCVEGEVGQVKGIEEDVICREESVASKEEIKLFLESVNIDLIAVAFGNAHGDYKVKPDLKYDLVEYTTSLSNVPFVVHGASGLSNQILKELISIDGVKKINISTDLKKAYKKGVELALDGWKQPVDASNIINNEIKKVAFEKMSIINSEDCNS